ncbi:MAG TPA: hypothetical protein PKC69_05445 [Chitinophagaceae bacterium]|nr:hypothetical protein [Chitinophagaceae bacterium]
MTDLKQQDMQMTSDVMDMLVKEQQKTEPATAATGRQAPDKDILYAYLFSGKITMEEYLFLNKKTIEGSVG